MARELFSPFSSAQVLEQTRARTHVVHGSASLLAEQQIDVTDPNFWDDPAYAHQVKGRRLGEFNRSTIGVAMVDARYACEKCGKAHILNAHHILPLGIARKDFSHIPPIYLAHFANCQIVCEGCHYDIHRVPFDFEYFEAMAQGLLNAVSTNLQEVFRVHRIRY